MRRSTSLREKIEIVFIDHFKSILAPKDLEKEHLAVDLSHAKVQAKLGNSDGFILGRVFDIKEIMDAIKSSSPNKSPGPDGFNSHFLKGYWLIIGEDVVAGMRDFFRNGGLLRQVKNTFIALVPKKRQSSLR